MRKFMLMISVVFVKRCVERMAPVTRHEDKEERLDFIKLFGGPQQLLTSGLWNGLLSIALECDGAESSSLAGCPPPVFPIVLARLRQGRPKQRG